MELNSIEELNKLEDQIKETQSLLEKKYEDNSIIERLKKNKEILSIFTLLFLITTMWFYYLYNKSEITINKRYTNLLQTNEDVLKLYKDSIKLFKPNGVNTSNANIDLNSEKIIYNIQLGAFEDFKITTNSLNKISKERKHILALGNYFKYKDAKKLQKNLKKIGFKDCFIYAQSYGNLISIKEALHLSNELEFLFK